MAKLKTREKTNEELLAEMNRAKEDWKRGKFVTLEESLRRIDLAIKRTREMERQFSEQEQNPEDDN